MAIFRRSFCTFCFILKLLSQGMCMEISNVFSDGMVLQQAPASALVFGFASPGVTITTKFAGTALAPVRTDSKGVWRVSLPPTPASSKEHTMEFSSSEGKAHLSNVLFGEVTAFLSDVSSSFGSVCANVTNHCLILRCRFFCVQARVTWRTRLARWPA